jgi:hypothetical protein
MDCRMSLTLVPYVTSIYNLSQMSHSPSYLSHCLFFFNIKLSIFKIHTFVDLIFRRPPVIYLFMNQITKVHSSVLYLYFEMYCKLSSIFIEFPLEGLKLFFLKCASVIDDHMRHGFITI